MPKRIKRNAVPFLACLLAALLAGCAAQQNPSNSGPTNGAALRDEDEDSESPGVFETVGSGISNFFSSITSGITQLAQNVSGNTPGRYARLMESQNADARRIGINGLAERDFGKRPPYTTRYDQIAQSDPDPLVRATAVRALNRSRDKSATGTFIKALADPSPLVRLEGAKALARVPDPDAVPPLVAILNRPDEDKDVRIAAADALKHYRTLEAARALASMLSNRDFGIAYQSRRSLKTLTGRDLRYDEAAWLEYITGPEKPFG